MILLLSACMVLLFCFRWENPDHGHEGLLPPRKNMTIRADRIREFMIAKSMRAISENSAA